MAAAQTSRVKGHRNTETWMFVIPETMSLFLVSGFSQTSWGGMENKTKRGEVSNKRREKKREWKKEIQTVLSPRIPFLWKTIRSEKMNIFRDLRPSHKYKQNHAIRKIWGKKSINTELCKIEFLRNRNFHFPPRTPSISPSALPVSKKMFNEDKKGNRHLHETR